MPAPTQLSSLSADFSALVKPVLLREGSFAALSIATCCFEENKALELEEKQRTVFGEIQKTK